MRQVFRMNEDGFFLEPVLVPKDAETPFDCTEVVPKDGLYKAKFDGSEWIEGADETYIASLHVTPEPTEIEKLQKQQADLMFELMMKGVI
jgi:hypothetical protein